MLDRTPTQLASRPVLNAVRVLETVADANEPLSLAEVCRLCKVPKATALRYLAAFEQVGYVLRDPDGRYSLGARVLALPRKYYGLERLLSIAREHLPELARATEETAHIGILQVPNICYIDIADSPQRIRAIVPRGEHLPAYCVASGRAILAHSSSEIIEGIIARGLTARTRFTITDSDRFRAELKRIARNGYAVNNGEWVEDVVGISAPLFSPEGQVFAAIGVSSPTSRVNAKRVKQLSNIVSGFAGKLSSSFGSVSKRSSTKE